MHKLFFLLLIVIIAGSTLKLYGQKRSITQDVRDRLVKIEKV